MTENLPNKSCFCLVKPLNSLILLGCIAAWIFLTPLLSRAQDAPDWHYLGHFYAEHQSYDTDNRQKPIFTRVYIDTKSIEKIDYLDGHQAALYQYTILEEYERLRKIGQLMPKYASKIQFLNCEDKNTGTGLVKLYDIENNFLTQTRTMPPTLRRIADDTIEYKIFEYLCF